MQKSKSTHVRKGCTVPCVLAQEDNQNETLPRTSQKNHSIFATTPRTEDLPQKPNITMMSLYDNHQESD
jgi:hypothetical protein